MSRGVSSQQRELLRLLYAARTAANVPRCHLPDAVPITWGFLPDVFYDPDRDDRVTDMRAYDRERARRVKRAMRSLERRGLVVVHSYVDQMTRPPHRTRSMQMGDAYTLTDAGEEIGKSEHEAVEGEREAYLATLSPEDRKLHESARSAMRALGVGM